MPKKSYQSVYEVEDTALISSGSSCENEEEMSSSSNSSSRKRKDVADNFHTSNKKPCSMDTLSWKDACLKAKNSFDDLSLPSLEEAAILFGFSS